MSPDQELGLPESTPPVTALAARLALHARLEAICAEVATGVGMEQVSARVIPGGGGAIRLVVQIDRLPGQGSVRMEDCVRVARRLGPAIDVAEPEIAEHYELEVSSPGMQRILRNEADFRRFSGMTARVTVRAEGGTPGQVEGNAALVEGNTVQVEGKSRAIQGVIAAVADGTVTLRLDPKPVPKGPKPAKVKGPGAKAARAELKKTDGKTAVAAADMRTVALADIEKAHLNPTIEEWTTLGERLKAENALRPPETDEPPNEDDNADDDDSRDDDEN